MMDRLLAILDSDPDFAHFMLDGQTISIEDYLEIRPEAEPRLRHHVKSGRLLIGPWYVLADQFLVGGELLVRNLMLGHQMAAALGPTMKNGYVPDSVRADRPVGRILRGFGIETAVIWRGAGE